mgnify:CR=1 FL=1
MVADDDAELYRQALASDFTTFATRCFALLLDKEDWIAPPYFQIFGDVGQRLAEADKHRIILNAPPRCGKSKIMSVAYPLWRLIREPRLQVLVISYGDKLNTEHVTTLRKIIESDWFAYWFPEIASLAQVTQKGLTLGTSGKINYTTVEGTVTGLGGDLIILDDLIKANEALQPLARERLETWLQSTLMTRLNDPRSGSFLLCMQRLHIEDITAFLLDRGSWHHIALPLIAKSRLTYPLLWGKTLIRPKGDVLEPARFSKEKIAELKRDLGMGFAAQYQQDPVAGEDGIFNVDQFQYYDEAPEGMPLCCSIDPAAEPGRGNDYSVFQLWGHRAGNHYLLDQERQQLDFGGLMAAYEALRDRWKFTSSLIETGGNGRALYQALCDRRTKPRPNRIQPKDSKEARAYRCTGLINGGHVFLPKRAPWLATFLKETQLFPYGRHDDCSDAMTQYLNYHLDRPVRKPGIGRVISYS